MNTANHTFPRCTYAEAVSTRNGFDQNPATNLPVRHLSEYQPQGARMLLFRELLTAR